MKSPEACHDVKRDDQHSSGAQHAPRAAPTLDEARNAFAGRRWRHAFDGFTGVDARKPLMVDDLERMALAAQLVGEDEAAAAGWERAHLALLQDRQLERAVRCAFWLAFGLMNRGQMARAGGWIGRAQRLIDDHELDCVEQGLLLVPTALRTLESGDPEEALSLFDQVLSIGSRFGDSDVTALGRLGRGRSLVVMGRDDEGLALLDEAMVAVTAGEVMPLVAGRIYCAVILVCHQAFDLQRAHEWTSALSAWCDAQPDIVPFRGQCLVHRSEVLQWHGDWSQAMDEAQLARERMSDPPDQPAIGMAFYQLGELYRLLGEFGNAEKAYREASRHGRTPQPGLSQLRLMQGDVSSAAATVRRVLSEPSDRMTRAKLLGAAVDILLQAGDDELAVTCAEELAGIARSTGAPVLGAMAGHAGALLALYQGDARSALDASQRAAAAWAQLGTPYEQARARHVAAVACRMLGDDDTARLEADAARHTFAELGAEPDLRNVDRAFDDQPHAGPLTARQVEVLALVAAGKTNREIADALFISEHTVRRHLQNIFTRIGVGTRAAATAYAYEHGLV